MKAAARLSWSVAGVLLLLASIIGACSSTDDFAVVGSSSSDASASTTTVLPDARKTTPIGPNLFGDHDGCNMDWQTESYAKLTDDPVARTGKSSCRVCSRPGFQPRLTVAVDDAPVLNSPLRLAVTIVARATDDRRPPDAFILRLSTFPQLSSHQEGDGQLIVSEPLTKEWREMHTTLAGSASESNLVMTITFDVQGLSDVTKPDAGADAGADAGPSDAGTVDDDERCFLVDDVILLDGN